jgi:NMT1/THI5 like
MLSIASATRRRLLGPAGAAISGLAGGLAIPRLVFAQNNKSVKFTLPWVPEGSDLFAFTAKGMGFWDKHGLDVSIARGLGSVAAAEATGTGRFDFGMAAAPAAIPQNVKGLPVTALGCCQYDEGRAPTARNKAGEIRKARGRRREQERNRATPRRWRPLCLRDAGGSLSLAGLIRALSDDQLVYLVSARLQQRENAAVSDQVARAYHHEVFLFSSHIGFQLLRHIDISLVN